MKILLDMNLSPQWVNVLEEAGFEAQHWSKLGPSDAPDQEIMAFAARSGFVVMTHDLDFSAILSATQGMKPSVVQIRARLLTPETIGSAIIAALSQTRAELEAGALLTIDTDRSRLRLLPLNPSLASE